MIAARPPVYRMTTPPRAAIDQPVEGLDAAVRFFKDLQMCPMIGHSMPADDLELVRRAVAREPDALRRLGERLLSVPRLLGCIVRRRGIRLHDSDLHDLSHEIITKAWRKIGEYRGEAPLEGWLWSFCVLELMNHLRRRGRGPRLFSDLGEDAVPEPAAEQQAPHEPRPLERWLRHLGEREAQVLELKMVDGLSFPEIGEALGVATSTAKTSYYRALDKLAKLREGEAAR